MDHIIIKILMKLYDRIGYRYRLVFTIIYVKTDLHYRDHNADWALFGAISLVPFFRNSCVSCIVLFFLLFLSSVVEQGILCRLYTSYMGYPFLHSIRIKRSLILLLFFITSDFVNGCTSF